MNTFLQNNPFFRLTIALALGIAVAFFNTPEWVFYCAFSVGILTLFCFYLLKKDENIFKYAWIFGVGIFLALFSIGGFLTIKQLENSVFPLTNRQGIFTVRIIEQPIEKPKSTMLKAEILSFKDSSEVRIINKKAIVYLAKDSLSGTLTRGDIIALRTMFSEPQNYNNPEAFNYKAYLKRQGIGATAYCNKKNWRYVTHQSQTSLAAVAEKCRFHLLNIYKQFHIEGDEFGMVAALTLGYKDALSPELRESFSTTGAMHVLAVSGLHVGIIFFVLGLLFKPLGNGKKQIVIRNLLIILFLWIYAFITGLSPSVCRATLMFSLVAIANMFNRQSSIYNTIFFSAFVLLLVNPSFLLEVGFQLSYCAVLAIVYFQPKLSAIWHPQNKFIKWCWELACVSIVAQIGTAPFAMYYFHQFPNYFLLTNFIVIPAASVIIYLAIALFLTSFIPYVGAAVAFLLNYVLKFINWCIAGIEHFPNALSTIFIGKEETLLLYALVVTAVFLCEKKNFSSVIAFLLLIFCFFSFRFYNHYNAFTTQEAVVFKHNKANIINFVSGSENLVITNDTVEARKLATVFWLKKQTVTPQFLEDSILHKTAVVCNDKRYLCITQSIPKKAKNTQAIKVDNLIIGRKLFADTTLFTTHFIPQQITIAECVPFYTARRIKSLASQSGIKCIGKE